MPSTPELHELVRIRVHGGARTIPVAAAAAAGVAQGLDFRHGDVERVRSVVEELARDIVENHFDDPQEADFRIVVGERRGGLVIRLEDEGLPYPFDRFDLGEDSLTGKRHRQGEVEAIRFESRGVEGNAIELTIHRNPERETHLEDLPPVDPNPVSQDAPIAIRSFEPEDAPGLARCVYRCYGYTYANDVLYYPDRVLSMIERDLLRSVVGVTPEGEVVGHIGLMRDAASSRIAESGMAVVDPRYRSHHLLTSIKARLSDAVEELGLVGTFADAVTVHPITQKANVEIGAHETGIMLAEIPATTRFQGFEEASQRGSVVVYYRTIGDAPEREVFFPERYGDLLATIYAPLGLRRIVRDPSSGSMPATSTMHVEVRGRRSLARIEVDIAGADLVPAIHEHLRELCTQRLDVVHLDLPLADPAAMDAVDEIAGLGFFFAAVIPELRDGDVLRLQYLNNVEIDPDAIVLYREEAKRLLEEILRDRG